MSLMNAERTSVATSNTVFLKTADQFDMWKIRITDACWHSTSKDVMHLTDQECVDALHDYDAKDPKAKTPSPKPSPCWVTQCWMIITSSIHDDLYKRVAHVPRGRIKSLLDEISHALLVTMPGMSVVNLRDELYSASMLKNCNCDLQLWVSFVTERFAKR